ncbi:hypothetical protein [Mycolicibacterium fluoranthenivorans]|uniref:Phage tail protein n=1 Tax=Mycolicibacterium fluoranthenivorans TaxID=258505 RepID=A0A1G4VFE3_9MYCO|nr:hypothetical protein [Mycolicibacterium fluoranthenivorans]SCX05986.1 hypothetical protein SAMN02799620_00792 [Mycolicibacterium fluoranthenivorans]
MAGDASNIAILQTGDVFVFDPDVVFVEGTHVPADIDAALHAAWLPGGLMKGDPGAEMPRDINRADVDTWQQGVVLERFKNPKSTLNFNLYEDNEATTILVRPGKVPRPVMTYVALEFVHEDGYLERRISKKKATFWVPKDDKTEDVKGRDVQVTLTPSGTDIWTIQEGIPA